MCICVYVYTYIGMYIGWPQGHLQGHLCLEVFLSHVEIELFELPKADIKYSNLSREEQDAIRSLVDDRNITIKKADKGSCIVIWGRNDYLMEAEK